MKAVLLVAVFFLMPLVVASATEPSNTYPAAVESVRHSNVAPGGELTVEVTLKAGKTAATATMYVCQFPSESAKDPDICYSPPIQGTGDGATFTLDSADTNHPDWKKGQSIGYKLKLKVDGQYQKAPSDGDYYRITVGEKESDALPVDGSAAAPLPLWVPLMALAAAIVVRRR